MRVYRAWFVVVSVVSSLFVAIGGVGGQASTTHHDVRDFGQHRRDAQWRLIAVEYARSHDVRQTRLVHGAPPSARVDMSWYFFVAVGHDRIVLVDTGSDALARPGRGALRARWSIAHAIPVSEALGRVGIAPDAVTDVVLTHHHWDHADGLATFTGATVHVMRDEWRRVPGRLRAPVERSGRLDAIDGSSASGSWSTLMPGLDVREVGAHTAHQLMVKIACTRGDVVVASDAAYLYRNITERRAVAVTVDRARNVTDVAAVASEVGAENVLPGHDPALFDRHPSTVAGVAAICP